MTDNAAVYWVWLQQAVGQGSSAVPLLSNLFSSPKEIYAADKESLSGAGLGEKTVENLCNKSLAKAQKILERSAKLGWYLTPDDTLYPEVLRQLYSPPLVLYGQGVLPDFDATVTPPIGVIGTRECTTYGKTVAGGIAAGLAAAGCVIVSGGARGIDCAAHEGALYAGGTTVVIKPCGLNVEYPKSTQKMRRNVLENNGAILTEYPPDTPAYSYHYQVRNRLISGLSWGICVVEAPEISGALITARTAREQSRDVFAVPGNALSPESAGSNALIKDGATMVTRAGEILQEYQYRCRGTLQEDEANTAQEAYYQFVLNKPPFPQKAPFSRRRVADATPVTFEPSVSCPQTATPTAKQVFETLSDSPQTAEWLCAATGLPAGKVFAALTELELFGCVKSYPGKRYSRLG